MTAKNKTPSDLAKASAADAIASLQTNAETGLPAGEIQNRTKRYGYNEVPERKENLLLRFAKKFWGLTAWMLELIIAISWLLHRFVDLAIVAGLLVLNAIISFFEEQRASGAVSALRKNLQVNTRVLRDGAWKPLPARELVPGDIVRLRPGDFVPADVKIVSGELAVDQSALTGESMTMEKKRDGLLYSGSVVRQGEANGVVILTGTATYYGRTTELVQTARPKLHMEEVISRIVKVLVIIVCALLAVAFAVSLLRGVNVPEILPLMLVLLLSAVPVALPVMFTVSMAVGSMELARKGVLVTRLSASEDAATMNVLCVDKTGTITMNKLSVATVIPLSGFTEADAILYGALASQEANQDPIDLAFLGAARQKNLPVSLYTIESFIPFDAKNRKTEVVARKGGQTFRAMKGAVATIASACGIDSKGIEDLEARASVLAQKGHRVLAVAQGEGQGQPRLVGMVTFTDSLRANSKELIEELKGLGISVKMLTGDALPIAKDIAREVGLGENVKRMADVEEAGKKDPALAAQAAEESDGFAEIYPEGKYNVVKSLQLKKHVVGMTGDGVNDAPALRQAEVGIAVSNAVDVAKGAASVVLTREGLSGVVELVTNGRMVYQRITTWVINKISRTIFKASFVVVIFLITGKFVISALGMILVVFMTDFAKISLSTDNVRGSRKPETWSIGGLVTVAVILGVLMIAESVGLYFIGSRYLGLSNDIQALNTFGFEIMIYFAIFSLFVVRERRHFWNSRPSWTLLAALLLDAIVAAALATFGVFGMKPIPFTITLFVVGYSFFFSLFINDLVKYVLVRRLGVRW
jgi:H+-transporting ATPase